MKSNQKKSNNALMRNLYQRICQSSNCVIIYPSEASKGKYGYTINRTNRVVGFDTEIDAMEGLIEEQSGSVGVAMLSILKEMVLTEQPLESNLL